MIARTLMKGGSLALLWLLLVPSVVSAAPGPRRGAGRVCDPSATSLRKLARIPKSFGGPIARPSPRVQAGLSDAVSHFQRGASAAPDDDDEAIQNDAPTAWIDPAEQLAPALEPLDILIRACVDNPKTHAFSPRSPRGPPLAG